ncbi:MAG: autotransporter outer membrane beta-barrel domain-containing protein [Rickettsiales bacterium]|jgi:predicted outer membrane repeat protein|nr:autotransporter outer membrane beta-barrel domain-containing protein [Rickettsiales bacterium]
MKRIIYTAILVLAAAQANAQTARMSILAGETQDLPNLSMIGVGSSAHQAGGALSNAGTLTVGNGAMFKDDFSGSMGGALFNSGTLSFGDNASFIDNYVVEAGAIAGAIFNSNTGVMTFGANALFEGNTSTAMGAAVYNQTQASTNALVFSTGRGARFINNTGSHAAAIYNLAASGTITVNIGEDSLFQGNTGLTGNGGAVSNWLSTMGFANGANFVGNTARQGYGGAVVNEGAMTFAGAASFANNSANLYGGAVANVNTYTPDTTDNEYLRFEGPATFSGNKAGTDGGALYNGNMLGFASGATFLNNVAGGRGGAVYNEGTLSFAGDVVFKGNAAAGKPNDIYNAGTLSFADGSQVSLDGGITGGTVSFGANSTLNATLSATPVIVADSITIGEGSSIGALSIAGGTVGDNIALVSGGSVSGGFTLAPSSYQSAFYNVSQNEDYTLNVSLKNAEQLALGMGVSAGNAAAALAVLSAVPNLPTRSAENNVFADISTLLTSEDDTQMKQGFTAVEALSPMTAPAVQASATQTAAQAFSVAGSRMGGGGPSMGLSSGDYDIGGATFWIQGLSDSAKLSGAGGFNSTSSGGAIGLEAESGDIKIGMAYAPTSTHIRMTGRSDDVDSDTGIFYASYKPGDWYANFSAGYTRSDYSEEKNVLGQLITGEYIATAYAGQVATGYTLHPALGSTISPEIGLRYIRSEQDAWTDSLGSRTAANGTDTSTGLANLRFVSTGRLGDVNVMPELRLGATYDFVTSGVSSEMTLANGASFEVSGDPLDRLAGEVGLSLTFGGAGARLAIGYEGKFRSRYTDNAGLITLKLDL